MKNYIIISLAALFCLTACETEFERVFKQHLFSYLTETQIILDSAEEGTEEGKYKIGSKDILQQVIDEGYSIYWDPNSKQETVDGYINIISEAVDTFKLSINPSLANIRSLLIEAASLIEIAEQNGVSQGNINSLQELIDSVQTALDNTSKELTQKEVLEWEEKLTVAISAIEEQMPGPIKIRIENPSFEPTNSTSEVITDFSLVSGWSNAGYVQGVNPWDGLLTNAIISKDHWMLQGKSVDKNYALYVQTYSKQVWQTLSEKVKENCTYTVTINVIRDQWKDAEKTKFLIQLISFEEGSGDFSNITILAQKEFSNISSSDFQECKLEYSPLVNPENIGKPITIALMSYYNVPANNSNELAWKDVGVSVDNINMIRSKN